LFPHIAKQAFGDDYSDKTCMMEPQAANNRQSDSVCCTYVVAFDGIVISKKITFPSFNLTTDSTSFLK
jgi:hypothetical protein